VKSDQWIERQAGDLLTNHRSPITIPIRGEAAASGL
jgi:hypothetical protein